MSVLEASKIDMWGAPKGDPERAGLGIADHLNWEPAGEGEHLELLQEKRNAYIRFIESGELLEVAPKARGLTPAIRIIGRYALSEQGARFIDQADVVAQGSRHRA